MNGAPTDRYGVSLDLGGEYGFMVIYVVYIDIYIIYSLMENVSHDMLREHGAMNGAPTNKNDAYSQAVYSRQRHLRTIHDRQ
jgi:hypothetical protein